MGRPTTGRYSQDKNVWTMERHHRGFDKRSHSAAGKVSGWPTINGMFLLASSSRRREHIVGFWCCFVVKPLFFHALACRPFALLVAPFFTSAVAPGAKLSRPRHHALGGTSLAHRRCIPSSSRICRMIRNGPPLPVCFIMSADEAVPSQGPQGRRPRAGARPRSLRFGHVHQPGSRMHAVLVEGQRLATRCRSPHRGAELAPQPRRPRSAREGLRGHRAAHASRT